MAGHAENIYVQIEIRGDMERIWELTQTPDLHERWDLRFTRIQYLPKNVSDEPQRFLYETRIGFGFRIRGEGESVGSRDGAAGERSSSLKFWSDDPKSLIRQGSGYWKYIPNADSDGCVRFLTGYDYDVRFGFIGRLIDRLIFRPLIGWATAWSFDRLRLWIERGLDPALAMRMSAINVVARSALAGIWLYEGIIPKLVYLHADELEMLHDAGFSMSRVRGLLWGIGLIEICVGAALILAWHGRWLLWFCVVTMPLAALGVAIASPRFVVAPFNPITLNLGVFALAAIGLLVGKDLPSARRCIRKPELRE